MASIKGQLGELCRTYLQGLAWVAQYYYQGCVSWKWYFPYRYAPLASDMTNLESYDIRMEMGEPFRPLEQLLGVLPPASYRLLPPAYRDLMLSPTSSILDFYPPTFKIDMNGKKNPWEGIALIPFIDEQRLLV
jgi:5'-3' exonuclease